MWDHQVLLQVLTVYSQEFEIIMLPIMFAISSFPCFTRTVCINNTPVDWYRQHSYSSSWMHAVPFTKKQTCVPSFSTSGFSCGSLISFVYKHLLHSCLAGFQLSNAFAIDHMKMVEVTSGPLSMICCWVVIFHFPHSLFVVWLSLQFFTVLTIYIYYIIL